MPKNERRCKYETRKKHSKIKALNIQIIPKGALLYISLRNVYVLSVKTSKLHTVLKGIFSLILRQKSLQCGSIPSLFFLALKQKSAPSKLKYINAFSLNIFTPLR